MPGIESTTAIFYCIGFFKEDKLVGFWDMPLVWLESPKIFGSAVLETPEFKALMGQPRATPMPIQWQ